jgi:predicted ABC-type ATPase
MSEKYRPVVIVVCGCPGAGKTTVASATARHLGVSLMSARLGVAHVSQDEFKNGLGLSSAHVTTDGDLRLDPEFAVAGGPFSLRAQAVALEIVRLLSSLAVSFVVETAVVSDELLGALRAGDARVLVIHVVAREVVIGERLRARAAGGSAVAEQLVAQFDRGELDPAIFKPSPRVGTVVEFDTSDHSEPNIEPIETAVRTMLR